MLDVDLHSSFVAHWGNGAAVPLLAAQAKATELIDGASKIFTSSDNVNSSLVQLAVRSILPFSRASETALRLNHGELSIHQDIDTLGGGGDAATLLLPHGRRTYSGPQFNILTT